MPFDQSATNTNNQFQYGMELIKQNIDYDDYQFEMIQKFYADADINTINQMTEWVKQPLMRLISLTKLKTMIIDVGNKQFKTWKDTLNVSVTNHKQAIKQIESCCEVSYLEARSPDPIFTCLRDHDSWGFDQNNAINWTKFVSMKLEFFPRNQYAPILIWHTEFVDLIYSIWVETNRKMDNKKLTKLTQTISEMQTEINQLKQKNADLSYQVQLAAYSLQTLQPANPVYDYAAIKSRKQKLHAEFKRLSKLMKLG